MQIDPRTLNMQHFFIIIFLLISTLSWCQSDLLADSKTAQENLNESFTNPEKSILRPEDFEVFDGLEFYPLNEKYIIKAEFVRTPDEKPFLMPTTTERLPEYVKYGEARFTLDDTKVVLSLYQSTEANSDYLFLPFTDLTSGDGSYGGGRYLDFEIFEGPTITIDFNKAYNPYCAYNPRYSCPIPPEENDIPLRIEAGVKDFEMN